MDNEFNTKEYVINEESQFEEITEEEYKEDFTSFEQEIDLNDDEHLDLIETRNQEETIKPKRKSIKEKWNALEPKKKTIIIVFGILLILLTSLLIYVLVKKEPVEKPKKEEPEIVIEKDNYRYDNGFLVLLDENDKEIGKYECKNKNENKCRVAYQNNEDNFDGEQYIYENGLKLNFVTPIINDTFAFIYDDKNEENGMVFLYDLSQNEILNNYNSVKYYNVNSKEYLVIENNESKYGLFIVEDSKLKQIIDFNYDYLGIKKTEMSEYNYLVAKKDGKSIIINSEGKELSKRISNNIKSFNKKYIVVDANGEYAIVDYRNNKILKNSYNYIILQDNYFIAIKDINKLMLYDYKETQLYNELITLPNEYYNKTYIYDENNKLLNTNESFWINLNEDKISIEYYKNESDVESKTINIYEGLVSQNYEYISYFDGSLYIYDDEFKTNLIGKYSCNNKNTINSIDSTYNNCYLAKESYFSDNELSNQDKTLGYLPLINKRYIFINDTIDTNTNNIVLYDLVENKTLGSYLSVDAGIYDGKSALGFLTSSDLKVIGKSSRKNKYGVISINNDSVNSVIAMEYDRIERLKDYYMVESSGATYQLFNENGEEITKPVGNKIVNFVDGYIKTKNNNKFSIYSFDLKSEKKDLDYLELKDKFFVTITNDKKVSVYNYLEFDNPIIDSYPLETEEYKYNYLEVSDNYEIIVTDELGERLTLSVIAE